MSYVTSFGTPGTGKRQFSNPIGVTVDSTDLVYVADTVNSRIVELNSGNGEG